MQNRKSYIVRTPEVAEVFESDVGVTRLHSQAPLVFADVPSVNFCADEIRHMLWLCGYRQLLCDQTPEVAARTGLPVTPGFMRRQEALGDRAP